MPNLPLLLNLFSPRPDVFAIHWQKGAQSGYAPAYQYDPYLYRQHKMGGGTLQNFEAKTYLPLTDEQITKHLNGQQFIGIYPLLTDNTSWWIAADFDGEGWIDACRAFIKKCGEYHIPAYLERSRSGNGGHVWIFFEKPYPAVRSRKVVIDLLEKSGVFSVFDKSASFDRLFPNQDFLSGKGLGNLITLPLHGPTVEKGNSCFIDPETLVAFPDQWAFLEKIQRIETSILDALWQKLDSPPTQQNQLINTSGRLLVALDNEVHIQRAGLSPLVINYLKDTFNFANSAFFVKEKSGRSTWKTARYFKIISESTYEVTIPRGSTGLLLRFCKEQSIAFDFKDNRKQLPMVPFAFSGQLLPHQSVAFDAVAKKDFGVIVAPPGSGKTVLGLKIIAEKRQPALILVHRKQLLDQWAERIQTFLAIPKHEIGIIGNGKSKPGKKITVATIQSVAKMLEKPDSGLDKLFGLILVDECHHVPADTFRDTISRLHTWYLYGLTATPFRKYNDGKIIFMYLGDVIAEIKPQDIQHYKAAKIIVRDTTLDIPFNPKTDTFEILSKVLVHDSARNRLILADIEKELRLGKKAIVLTERKEHIEAIKLYLKPKYEVVTLSGDDTDNTRAIKWKQLHSGNYQVLITTGQLFGEGADLSSANCLFLVYPFSFEGKLIQYIGRVQRGEITPVIYDYHDRKVDYLHRMFLKRNMYYRKITREATLFDDPDPGQEALVTPDTLIIQEKIRVKIEDLEFQYGSISFHFTTKQLDTPVLFEIENDDVRPEFNVLKPYFVKVLQTTSIEADIYLEIQHHAIMAMSVHSEDMTRINRELIEGVKFRFVEKQFIGQKLLPQGKEGLLDIDQIQDSSEKAPGLYPSGEALLDDILNKQAYKHSRQLRYLAQQHQHTILKLRFVLSPFSFVFLLAGEAQYHIVLETLHTEEATYIWHVVKDRSQLREVIKGIDNDLQTIRQHGRQYFLETHPTHFSRVLHDYSDERKGFVVWKDMLESLLV